ncbi:MAG: MFS transporter, partial [Pseudolabrys sp.]
QIPIASLSDRHNRVFITWVGALAWAFFSLLTGLAWSVIVLGIARAGSGIGKAVVDPTHNSLIADYYDIPSRPRVYSFHRAANAVGAIIGPLTAGIIAYRWGWRWPFIIFTFPTLIFVVLAWRLREPKRGVFERRAAGASEEAAQTEEARPSFAESWRIVWKIDSLRRIWYALPFLAVSLIGFSVLSALLYEQIFHLDERARGVIAACVEPAQLIGLIVGARIATRVMAKGGAEAILGFLSKVAFVICVGLIVFALAPYLWVTIVVNFVITGMGAILAPGIFAALSLAIPPRARSMGFSVASLWIIPGLVILPIIGYIGDHAGLRTGLLLMTPLFLIGGLILGTTKNTINSDIADVWRATAARSEVAYERAQGRAKLLLVRGLEVSYGSVQVLFDVDMEVDEGTCVALLGTNGAGKSTLLKAISGVVEADRGTVIFDGREMTHAPPNEIAAFGIRQVPGGQGVFLNLTVEENLHCASWLHRHDKEAMEEGIERVLALFPVLADRIDDPAGNLSGGQQQMLALGMAFLSKPRLLMIDELS